MTKLYKFFIFLIIALFYQKSFTNIYKIQLQDLYSNQLISEKNAQLSNQDQIIKIYKLRNFEPLWLDNQGNFKLIVKTLLSVLDLCENEGLDPQDYQQAKLSYEEALKDSSKKFKAETILTLILMRYMDDIQGERLHPKEISKDIYVKSVNYDAAEDLNRLMNQDSSLEWLTKFTLDNSWYQIFKKKLYQLRQQNITSPWPYLSSKKFLKKGVTDSDVKILQTQLKNLGYYKNIPNGLYDQETVEAVKSFQTHQNTDSDGLIGPYTKNLLNDYNPQNRIKKLIIAMERCRWLPRDLGKRFILVNIPTFELFAYEDKQLAFSMAVIIGQNYRKTPVFGSTIHSIRFNPSWHVPKKIAIKDKIPKILKDPTYFEKGHFTIYDKSGQKLNSHEIDWHQYSENNFPFKIVQAPGEHNALGKIRFSIDNPFDVYLHDTSNPELFAKGIRNLSSGCIRLSNPQKLAVFVFNNLEKWPLEKIKEKMAVDVTENVTLDEPVNVYISYFTAWPEREGDLKFVPDIYEQDELIWQAIQKVSFNRSKNFAIS